jgi:hypothetical protein
MLNTFTRLPVWLREALGLQRDQVPNALDVERVLSVLDVGHGGWHEISVVPYEQTQPQNTAATPYLFFPAETAPPVRGVVVLHADVTHTGGAGAVNVQFTIFRPGDVVTPVETPISVNPAVGAALDWNTLYSGQPLLVPPDFIGGWIAPVTGAGETVRLRAQLLRFRRGFKPL